MVQIVGWAASDAPGLDVSGLGGVIEPRATSTR